MGCYSDPNIQTDGVQQHAVSSTFADSATLTQASCALSCEKLGFGYAAVEVSWLLLRSAKKERGETAEGRRREQSLAEARHAVFPFGGGGRPADVATSLHHTLAVYFSLGRAAPVAPLLGPAIDRLASGAVRSHCCSSLLRRQNKPLAPRRALLGGVPLEQPNR